MTFDDWRATRRHLPNGDDGYAYAYGFRPNLILIVRPGHYRLEWAGSVLTSQNLELLERELHRFAVRDGRL